MSAAWRRAFSTPDKGDGRWADCWCNRKNGVLNLPSWGGFHGVGTWDAPDIEAGTAVIVRGAWDRITPTSRRWH